MDILLNWLIQFCTNNTINLRHLSQRIVSCHTHKMAIVWVCDVTSPYVYHENLVLSFTFNVYWVHLQSAYTVQLITTNLAPNTGTYSTPAISAVIQQKLNREQANWARIPNMHVYGMININKLNLRTTLSYLLFYSGGFYNE